MDAVMVSLADLEWCVAERVSPRLVGVFGQADIWTAAVLLAEQGLSLGEIAAALDAAADRATSLSGIVLSLTGCVI